MNNIIILGADHNGVEHKRQLTDSLRAEGYVVIDVGPYDTTESVDYVDYAKQVSHIVEETPNARGILICGTGVGMSIAANRYGGVRAALVHNTKTAPKCREHNDANILCLGSWVNTYEINKEIVDIWMNEAFGEGRHNKRLAKLENAGSNIVFTNGVFDILHTGHLELLQFSKRLGDRLVVAINSDASVKSLKGDNRPINNEANRKKLLESLIEVDEVIIFDDNLEELRNQIEPNIVVKGGEWTAEQVRKRDNIPEDVEIKLFPLVKDYSTTNTIRKIQSLDGWQKNEF
jgi:ribose 5-phosphate isomerase B